MAVDGSDDPKMPGEISTTWTCKQVSVGAEITVVQEGLPPAIPEDGCYLGWQDPLEQLARLVQPEIPDA